MGSDILGQWMSVGEKMYQRTELYFSPLKSLSASSPADFSAAPYGGPILTMVGGDGKATGGTVVKVLNASGEEMASWKWKNSGVKTMGWSHKEDCVFLLEDGTVLIYSIHGELLHTVSMGQEAKDLSLKGAKIFRNSSSTTTGAAVLTTSNRFFLVNNLYEPRLRRIDHELKVSRPSPSSSNKVPEWTVMMANPRQATIVVGYEEDGLALLSVGSSDLVRPPIDTVPYEKGKVRILAVSHDGLHLAVYFQSGVLYLGQLKSENRELAMTKLCSVNLAGGQGQGPQGRARNGGGGAFVPDSIAWCGSDSALCFSSLASQCLLVSKEGCLEATFLPGFVGAVSELDSARIFSTGCQERIQCVPDAARQVLAIGSVSPGAKLRLASEEFSAKSHRAQEHVKRLLVADNVAAETSSGGTTVMAAAVAQCIEAACFVSDPVYQKELLRAAQLGKAFLLNSSYQAVFGAGCVRLASAAAGDAFADACRTLRVLNTLKHYKVGMPLTIEEYRHLTPRAVVDRLLNRRLFPLADMICQWLGFPDRTGRSRVLAHWACYKVGTDLAAGSSGGGVGGQQDLLFGGDGGGRGGLGAASPAAAATAAALAAAAIRSKIGNNPHISYSDMAHKAEKAGKRDLAVKLLEYETSVAKQVPLLLKLNQENQALTRALASGDRDLVYSVIVELRKKLPSTDFHMLVRKFPLAKTLYEAYCRTLGDSNGALLDWYIQEDDFGAQAALAFQRTMSSDTARPETRIAHLISVQELFIKAKNSASSSSSSTSAASSSTSTTGIGNGDSYAALVEEQIRLLRCQTNLESKLPGKTFVGSSLVQTIGDLVLHDELKLAEKVRADFKLDERRFMWIKLDTWARLHRWEDLKKYVKITKKKPVPNVQVVKLAKKHGGAEEAAKQFLKSGSGSSSAGVEGCLTLDERCGLLAEFGLFEEAASVAFAAKSLEALVNLEKVFAGRDEVVKMISNFKARLILK